MADGNDNIGRVSESGEAQVGIFWMISTRSGAQLLTASCPLSEAEPYGDCLTFGPGHYQVWQRWRKSRDLDAEARAMVRVYEYEDWPRERVVFNRTRDGFVLYADRRLMGPAVVQQVCERFNLPSDKTAVEGDTHYRSRETSGS
jgi:hypothetical protein